MQISVLKVNAFTDKLNGGNPAGVVFNSPDLSVKEMCHVSSLMKVSETAFFYNSEIADYKVLFFTPTVEVDLCGHATIASFFSLGLTGKYEKNIVLTQQTKAGILPVELLFIRGVIDKVMMIQKKPSIKDIQIDISKLSSILNIKRNEIDTSLPSQIVSSGLFTLPVCVKSFDCLKDINPDFEKTKEFCRAINVGSIHVFTFETIQKNSLYHARNFAPLYGVNEDPVTGTANGAVCYYLKNNNSVKGNTFICEQGDIINRSGRVEVNIEKNTIKVGGKAKIVEKKEIKL